MWSAAPPGQGHLSSKGFLEQVSTLQPSAENLFTVACPIPRLAPVRTSVRFSLVSTIFDLCGAPYHTLSELQL